MNCISCCIACDINDTYQDTILWNPAYKPGFYMSGGRYQPNCFHEKQIKIMFILCTSTYCTVVKRKNFDTHDPQLST